MREPKQCKQCGRTIYFDGICVRCRNVNTRNDILALTDEEVNEKIEYICHNAASLDDHGQVEDICKLLIRYRDINTSKIAEKAWEHKSLYVEEIYKDAPEKVVDEMIEMLNQDDLPSKTANRLLTCLAVSGGEKVFAAFKKLEAEPKAWSKGLYVPPSYYAVSGGWTYDKDGNFMKTCFDTCYPLVEKLAEEREKSPVKIATPTDEICPDCGCKLVNLLEVNGNDEKLGFLGIDGVVKAKCCPNCMIYIDAQLSRYNPDNGEWEIISSEKCYAEEVEDNDWVDEMTSNTYALGDKPVPLRYATDWEGGSSIGGFGFWIQDCVSFNCPVCGKPMMYLGQVQWDDVQDMEGNAYVHICKDCKVTAVSHQQT